MVAPCASVSRPTLPDLEPETVDLDIDPSILAEDAALLHTATADEQEMANAAARAETATAAPAAQNQGAASWA